MRKAFRSAHTSYLYDHDGNLSQVTDRNGLITQYQTDVVNRTTTETWLDTDDTTVIRSIISTYDADGRLISVTDHDGSDDPIAADYTYDYDDTARTLTTTTEIANMSVPVVFTETFNGNNERTQLAASIDGTNDFVNNYHYDHLGREDQVIQEGNGGNSVPTKRVDFGYNLDSQFDHIDRYNSSTASAANLVATSTYGYDEANRLTSLTYVNDTTTYAGFGYDYNAGNLLITSTNSADTSENATFTYDNSGQLLTADRSGTSFDENYSYDAAGNRLSFSNGIISRTYTIDPNNQLYSDGVNTYLYDAEGNRIRRTQISTGNYVEYHYDHRNRLTEELFKDSGGNTTRTVEYTYDAFDRLIYESSQLTGFPGASQFLIYDGQQAVLVTDSAGDVEHRLLWGPQVDQALADDNPVSGDVYWNLTDQQNTVQDLVEYFGSYDVEDQQHNVFNSFGQLHSQTGSADDVGDGYTGRYDDSWTGLQWNGERWYDPNVGRWLTEDPLGFAGGDSNLYRYVGNSPTNATDPRGLEIDSVSQSITRAVAEDNLQLLETLESSGGLSTEQSLLARNGIQTLKECTNANKLWHIFGDPGHKLVQVVGKFATQKQAYLAIRQGAIEAIAKQGLNKGLVKVVVDICGQSVTVEGNISNGVLKIGTAYVP